MREHSLRSAGESVAVERLEPLGPRRLSSPALRAAVLGMIGLSVFAACGLPLDGLGPAGDPSPIPDATTSPGQEGGGDETATADVLPTEDGRGESGNDATADDATVDSPATRADGGGGDARDARRGDEALDAPADDARAADTMNGVDGADATEEPDAAPPGDDGAPDVDETGSEAGGPPPPAVVQFAYATPQTPEDTVPVVFPGPQTVGDLNVVVVGWSDTSANVDSISDSLGNVYTLAIGPTQSPTAFSQSIYYATNVAGGATNTVTVHFDAQAMFPDVRILEYSGIGSTNPVDGALGSNGATAATTVGPVAAMAGDLLVAATTVATTTVSAGAGFMLRVLTMPDGDAVEDRVAPTAASYTASTQLSVAGAWVMQLVAFRPN